MVVEPDRLGHAQEPGRVGVASHREGAPAQVLRTRSRGAPELLADVSPSRRPATARAQGPAAPAPGRDAEPDGGFSAVARRAARSRLPRSGCRSSSLRRSSASIARQRIVVALEQLDLERLRHAARCFTSAPPRACARPCGPLRSQRTRRAPTLHRDELAAGWTRPRKGRFWRGRSSARSGSASDALQRASDTRNERLVSRTAVTDASPRRAGRRPARARAARRASGSCAGSARACAVGAGLAARGSCSPRRAGQASRPLTPPQPLQRDAS